MPSRRDLAHWYADTLFRYQKPVLAVIIALTLGFGFFIKDLRIDNSVEVLFQRDSPIVQAYNKFTEIFGNAELAVLAFKRDDGIFRPETLELIEALTNRIEDEVRHVESVVSLTNVNILDSGAGGSLEVRPLLDMDDGVLEDEERLEEAFRRAIDEPYIDKTLISEDGSTTSLVVKTVYLEGNQTYRKELTDDLRTLLDEVAPEVGTDFYLGGPPVFLTYFDEYILEDLLTFAPLIVLVLFGILFITFRSWMGVLIPMGVVGVGAIITVGFMGLMGLPITLATTIVPPLLFVLGVEDAIYVLSFFQREAAQGRGPRDRAYMTSVHTNVACLLTSVTTAIGFGALMITDINAVHETGMITAVGTMAIWMTNNLLLPILLQWVPYPQEREEVMEHLESGFLNRVLDKLIDWNLAHPWRVLGVGLLLTGVFIPGVMYLKVETNFVKYFHEESPIAVSQRFIQENLSGVAPMEILVDTGEPDGMKDPQVLREMAAIEEDLYEHPVVDWVFGTHDFYLMMHHHMTGATATSGFPITEPSVISQYTLLYDIAGGGAGLEDFVSEDRRYGRVSARLKDASTSVLEGTLADTREHFESPPSGAEYRFADNTAMLVSIVDAMLLNTAESLLLATVFIWILIAIYVRSIKVSLLFMIPNLIPVGAVLGLMGYTGVELNISTMMIGAVAIGLAVNNTIHIFAHFPRSLAHCDGDLSAAAHETMHSVGRACVSAGISIMFGFLILALSNFYPNLYFGTLSAFTVAIAVICDISVSYTIWILLGKRGYRGPAHMRR